MGKLQSFFKKLFPGDLTTGLTRTQKTKRGVAAAGISGGLMYGIEKVAGEPETQSSIEQTFGKIDISKLDIDPNEF